MAEIVKKSAVSDNYQTAIIASREAYRKSIVQKRYDKFFKKEETEAADVIADKMSGGKTLAILAIAQRYPGIRLFFGRVARFLLKKGLKNLDKMVLDKDLEKTVTKFNRGEATVYTLSLIHI